MKDSLSSVITLFWCSLVGTMLAGCATSEQKASSPAFADVPSEDEVAALKKEAHNYSQILRLETQKEAASPASFSKDANVPQQQVALEQKGK